MIIAVINEKGGSGKTTLAINLAIKLSLENDKVLFIDTDPQKSGELFSQIRKNENIKEAFVYKSNNKNLLQSLKNNLNKFDSIVIDTGGRDNKESREALSVADIILIPTYPSQYDLAVLNNMLELYKEAKNANSKCFIIISRASTNAGLKNKIDDFKNIIKPKTNKNIILLESILYDREAYRSATTQGLGISEMPQNKAKDEFSNLFKEILNICNNN